MPGNFWVQRVICSSFRESEAHLGITLWSQSGQMQTPDWVWRQLTMQKLQVIVFTTAFSLMLGEYFIGRLHGKRLYAAKETLANLGVLVGMMVSKAAFLSVQVGLFAWVHQFAPSKGLLTHPWMFLVCFAVVDLAYYAYHRWSHVVPFMWAFHMVHHTTTMMNFSASLRLNWFSPLLTVPFFAPLALLFPPSWLAASLGLNLLYQLWLHTELVGPLKYLEGWLNTPSAHRVHHARNEPYLDKNCGGVLMIWDRLFNTYQGEFCRPDYGVTTGFTSYNPFRLVAQGFLDWAEKRGLVQPLKREQLY